VTSRAKHEAVGLVAVLATAVFAVVASSTGAQVQGQAPAPDGGAVFNARCKSCHEPPVGRAPGRAELAQRPRADIVRAMSGGIMTPMAAGLSPEQIDAVAAYLTTAPSAEDASAAGLEHRALTAPTGGVGPDPMCKVNPPIRARAEGDWPTAGVDDASRRYQPHPGLTAQNTPNLVLKWSFSMVGGGQPTVVGDWLFITNRNGRFYALDAKTGCVHWALTDAPSRTTPMIVRSKISPSGWATFIGEPSRTIHAFDAQTGKPLWTSEVLEAHTASVLTGSPIVADGRIFVPISSIEEASSMSKAYVCCTFRGSVAALDETTGKLLWKTPMIDGPMQTLHRAAKDLTGPAGAAVWAAPSVDRKRGLVYVATGDSYTDVPTDGDDAVVALDMKTGKIRWRRQVTTGDNFVMGCGPKSTSGNCPSPTGPDYDFGTTPILFTLKDGRQVLMAGQKSGLAYGFDPDTGELLWKTAVGDGSALGGIEWGMAADKHYLFAPVSDIGRLFRPPAPGEPAGRPGLYALDPANGAVVWSAPAPVAPCHFVKPAPCFRAQSAAPAAMPGVVFSGTLDGWFRAYDANTGKVIWAYSTTAQTYSTLNGVPAQPGGGIDGMGPAIAGGMVYTMSGFNGAARVGGNGVNVLLAFGLPDGT
jgi:polyvinyl alcohol dehydrogenase (cytochrome)